MQRARVKWSRSHRKRKRLRAALRINHLVFNTTIRKIHEMAQRTTINGGKKCFSHAPSVSLLMHHPSVYSCTIRQFTHAPSVSLLMHHPSVYSCTIRQFTHAPSVSLLMHHPSVYSCTIRQFTHAGSCSFINRWVFRSRHKFLTTWDR